MSKTILVRGARQLLTLRGPSGPRRGEALNDLGILEDGALLIADGTIHSVGSSRRIENLAEARKAVELTATGCVVMPGFVDSHTHLIAPPASARDELLAGVKIMRQTPARKMAARADAALHCFLAHGTTSLEAKSGYGLDQSTELRILKVYEALRGKPADIYSTYFGANAVPTEFEGRADDYLSWVYRDMLPLIARRKLAAFVDVRCEPEAFPVEQARRYLESASRLGFLLKAHGSVALAVELDAVSMLPSERVSEHDIELLAASHTIATLLPGATFYQGSERYAPGRSLIGRGVAIALATGYNPVASPSCNMQMMIAIASSAMRLTPAEAISAATINGAHALRIADRAGSLEYGKRADLLVLNVADYREIPRQFGVNLVKTTVKRGEIVFERPGWS